MPDAAEFAVYLWELDRKCEAGEPMSYREWELHQYDHQGCGH